MKPSDFRRPYLVIPKLVEQPTWGGELIVQTKHWSDRPDLAGLKIGQSYELYSRSNLSLLESTEDPAFVGELSDRDSVAKQTRPDHSIALSDLIGTSPVETLGQEVVDHRGAKLDLLIKYTQALGNSFQTHIKDGVKDPNWLPKPESWYYFEPGLVTLGVKPGIDWTAYEAACFAIHDGMTKLGQQVQSGQLAYSDAQPKIKALIMQHDPYQYVNLVSVAKDQLVDLSAGGLHHSWEEGPVQAPHGNVLYELQAEAFDAKATFRNFDKGKMESDGSIRSMQIDEYFDAIDRSPAANDPANHMSQPKPIRGADGHSLGRLMTSRHYTLDKLTLTSNGATFEDMLKRFIHLFVKSGRIQVTTGGQAITVGTNHSCFIPAAAQAYEVTNLEPNSEVLISY